MSIFTKRHYSWLSSALRDHLLAELNRPNPDPDTRGRVLRTAQDLADALEAESPYGFNRFRFIHDIFCPIETKIDA